MLKNIAFLFHRKDNTNSCVDSMISHGDCGGVIEAKNKFGDKYE